MSVIEQLRNSPKGQLTYTRRQSTSDLQRLLDQVSPVPLSRPHKERESSKFNLSFGLDSSTFSDHVDLKPEHSNNDIEKEASDNKKEITNNFVYGSPCVVLHRTEKHDLCKDDLGKSPLDGPDKSSTPNRTLHKLSSKSETQLPNISELDISEFKSRLKSSSSIKIPPDPELCSYGVTSCAIKDEEDRWQEASKVSLLQRCKLFNKHEKAMQALTLQKEMDLKAKLHDQVNNRQSMIERKQQEAAKETQKLLQRLKENNEKHQMKIVTKNKEIEYQRQKLEEEEKARQAVRKEKLQRLKSVFDQVNSNRLAYTQTHDGCPFKDQLGGMVDKFRQALESVCAKLGVQLQAAEQGKTAASLEDLIANFEEHHRKTVHAVSFLKKEISEAELRLKEEELKNNEAQQKQAEEQRAKEAAAALEKQAMESFGIQALAHIVRESKDKQNHLTQVETSLKNFIDNAQMKKYRFNLQRAVNTPINAISAISGSHLRDKLQRLHSLLSGQPVEVSGKQVAATEVPEGPAFCQNLVAKMLVRKGEEQVTSHHEAAFAISAVAVGLWVEFPAVGDLILGHLQALCPYVLPVYAERQEGQSGADYHRSLGYKVSEDGVVEEQDKFLRRMSGLMRFYCACMVSTPPKGAASPHPHGLEHAWMWLARTMNLDPHPDVTATMIHDVLAVTGHALFNDYRVQFVKLVHVLRKEYLPKLKSVSVTSAAVGRLELFLEQTLKDNCRVPPPEGLLPPNFWQTR